MVRFSDNMGSEKSISPNCSGVTFSGSPVNELTAINKTSIPSRVSPLFTGAKIQ